MVENMACVIIIIIIGIQPLGRSGQRPELSQATGMSPVRCILGKFLGVVCHCFPPRLEVPTFPTRRKVEFVGEKCPVILPKCRLPRYIQGSFTCRKSASWDRRLYFPSEGRRAEDFFALKNPTASAGFEPANLGTKGQHATPRPPEAVISDKNCEFVFDGGQSVKVVHKIFAFRSLSPVNKVTSRILRQ